MALTGLWIPATVNLAGVRQMAWFQNLTVVLTFLPLLFVGVAGWFFAGRSVTRNHDLCEKVAEVLDIGKACVLRTDDDIRAAMREQWDDGTNPLEARDQH